MVLTIFVLGVLTGLFLGAFLWTALAVREAERELAQRLRIARTAWEREAALRTLERGGVVTR